MIPVAVVGAGPVGLFLACLLSRRGVETVVLERRAAAGGSPASARSIGLHPPALEALDTIGLAAPLIDCGVAIRRAQVFDEKRLLGSLSLERCPPPFPFVLSLPQGVTEGLLVERLEQLAPGSLRRGTEVASVRRVAGGFELGLRGGGTLAVRFLVGSDGHRSIVRGALATRIYAVRTGHHYLMADLPDSSDLGKDAAFFLGRAGVVESFPLPGSRRRWVARLDTRPERAAVEQLRAEVEERTGRILPEDETHTASLFTAENRTALPLAGERWALVGDAAHVVSPIGGQGMNLGLLGARALVEAGLGANWRPQRYELEQHRRARRATWRASMNMTLGGRRMPNQVRRALLAGILSRPLAGRAARYFTMRGL